MDFYCPEKKLAVELDGGFHRKRKEYDKERDVCLNKLGINVLRFWNDEVLNNVDSVVEIIGNELRKRHTPSVVSTRHLPLT